MRSSDRDAPPTSATKRLTRADKTYDVFVSYARRDRSFVDRIVRCLEARGCRVFYDGHTTCVRPGDRWEDRLEEGLLGSTSCVVFVGAPGPTEWQSQEMRAAIREETSRSGLRVIPVLLPKASESSLPPFLRRYDWVDFRSGADDEDAFKRLLAGVKGVVESGADIDDVPADSLFARTSTRELLERFSPFDLTGVDYDTSLPLHDLARLVKLHHPRTPLPRILKGLLRARSKVYDEKYSRRTEREDERYLNFEGWQQELDAIVARAGNHRPEASRALVVGIGNGNERPRLYSRFRELTVVDISPASLDRAARHFPAARRHEASAEALSFAADGSYDVYIALRTFQSSFFNVRHAAFEANRVLRRDGVAVISVPNVYVGAKKAGKGLQRGDGFVLDPNLSWGIADSIRRALLTAEFDCGMQTGLFEIYVTGKKVAP